MRHAAVVMLVGAALGCRGDGPSGATSVVSLVQATLPAEELARLPQGFEARAAELGWRRTPTGFEGTFPIPDAELLHHNAVVTESSGAAPKIRTAQGLMPLRAVRDPRTGRAIYQLVVPFGPEAECCVGAAAAGDEPMEGRCLDYNGTYTDGKNYPKSDPRAFRNFIGSDCSIALSRGYCGGDHINGGCYKNHGGKLCSDLIGHSSSYHTH